MNPLVVEDPVVAHIVHPDDLGPIDLPGALRRRHHPVLTGDHRDVRQPHRRPKGPQNIALRLEHNPQGTRRKLRASGSPMGRRQRHQPIHPAAPTELLNVPTGHEATEGMAHEGHRLLGGHLALDERCETRRNVFEALQGAVTQIMGWDPKGCLDTLPKGIEYRTRGHEPMHKHNVAGPGRHRRPVRPGGQHPTLGKLSPGDEFRLQGDGFRFPMPKGTTAHGQTLRPSLPRSKPGAIAPARSQGKKGKKRIAAPKLKALRDHRKHPAWRRQLPFVFKAWRRFREAGENSAPTGHSTDGPGCA